MSRAFDRRAQPPAFDIGATLATALDAVPVPPARAPLLQSELMDRVRHSARIHRAFTTVRREDAVWATVQSGVRRCVLSAQQGLCVDLVELAPLSTIPWPAEALALEVLVIGGMLSMDDGNARPIALPALQHAVIGAELPWRLTAGPAGARLYVRERQVDLALLPDDEAQWWRSAQRASLSHADLARSWTCYLDGVDADVLHAEGDIASMLVRIAPGAMVPDHGHPLAEDCFVLEGDMFLGDILMRPGDYQLAPVGCEHVGITSDLGGLFYFHGAIPPTASGSSK